MDCVYKENDEESQAFALENPQFGLIVSKKQPSYLYFRKYKDGRERWEIRFPHINSKGRHICTFLVKEEAIYFKDLYLEKWKKDAEFCKKCLQKAFFSYKYHIQNEDGKQEEIKSLKMQIDILSEVLKELESES